MKYPLQPRQGQSPGQVFQLINCDPAVDTAAALRKGVATEDIVIARMSATFEDLTCDILAAIAGMLDVCDVVALHGVSRAARRAVAAVAQALSPSSPTLARAYSEMLCAAERGLMSPAFGDTTGHARVSWASSEHCAYHGARHTVAAHRTTEAWVSTAGPAPRVERLEYELPCAHCALHALSVEMPWRMPRAHYPAAVRVHVGQRSGGPWSWASAVVRFPEDDRRAVVAAPEGVCPVGRYVMLMLWVEPSAAPAQGSRQQDDEGGGQTVAVDRVLFWYSQGPACRRSVRGEGHERPHASECRTWKAIPKRRLCF
eukprot:m51a1_g419 hypothetical protein (314) ;mRNA; f:13169-16583